MTDACAMLIAVMLTAASPARAGRLTSVDPVTHALAERLHATGRAEVQIERLSLDPISGRTVAVRGELVLEPPDRAALEFPATGERVTMRSDGGEWLQPGLRQLVRLGAGDAALASRWWELLVRSSSPGFGARRWGERRYRVIAFARGGLAADSANIMLAADGLPLRLEIEESPGSREMYRFRDWRFARPRGREGFVIRPPRDFEVVRLH